MTVQPDGNRSSLINSRKVSRTFPRKSFKKPQRLDASLIKHYGGRHPHKAKGTIFKSIRINRVQNYVVLV